MISIVVVGIISIILFVVAVLAGVAADNTYHMTGRYPYKVDLYAVANLSALLFLLSFAYILSKTL